MTGGPTLSYEYTRLECFRTEHTPPLRVEGCVRKNRAKETNYLRVQLLP